MDKKDKIKFTERMALKFRRKWLSDGIKTILIIAILFAAYIAINVWAEKADLPQIDLSKNKIYTLSDASKDAVKNIEQETMIYVYGVDEKSSFYDLLKQYNDVNQNIKYKIINEATDLDMVQEYELSSGYQIVIIKSNESEKVIDVANDFMTTDYTTYSQVDITEQVLTNSILALVEENKPKVYFLKGHNEVTADYLTTLQYFLTNEAYETADLNITTQGNVPEDCDVLAILSPTTDLFESEVQPLKDYIARGGKIFFANDSYVASQAEMPNWKIILNEYGVEIQEGFVFEFANGKASSDLEHLFIPEVSSTHEITADIYTDSYYMPMYMIFASRLKFAEDLTSLGVIKESLITSSAESKFITDINSDLENSLATAPAGISEIGSVVSKTVTTPEGEDKTSKLVIIANGTFFTELPFPLDTQGTMIEVYFNKDVILNSIAFLAERENTVKIRKDLNISSYAYTPTEQQARIVLTIIYVIPAFIIIAGIIIWRYRIKKK